MGGRLPSGITFGRGPPLPVTLRLTQRLMTPTPHPPKMTKGVMTPLPPFIAFQQHPLTSVRIASPFSLFSFAIFFGSTKRIFPDLGVPYPLVSTFGFAIFATLAEIRSYRGAEG